MDRTVSSPLRLTTSDVHHYQTRGWVFLENAIGSDLLVDAHARLRDRQAAQAVAQTERYNESGRVDLQKIPNLARRDESFLRLATAPAVAAAVEQLLGQEPLLFRDVMIVKPARDGAPLDYHQDSAYWDVEPRALISAWFPFRDVDVPDGCLRVIDGSHLQFYQHDIMVDGERALPGWMTAGLRRLASRAGTGDSDASGSALARRLKNAILGQLTRHFSVLAKLQDLHARVPMEEQRRAVDLPMRVGSVLLFHSMLLHASCPNTSTADRPAYIASYMGSDYEYVGVGEPKFLAAHDSTGRTFKSARRSHLRA